MAAVTYGVNVSDDDEELFVAQNAILSWRDDDGVWKQRGQGVVKLLKDCTTGRVRCT